MGKYIDRIIEVLDDNNVWKDGRKGRVHSFWLSER